MAAQRSAALRFLRSVSLACLNFPFDNSVTVCVCFLPAFMLFAVSVFPFIRFVSIIGISCFRNCKNLVEIMHRLESIPVDYPRQTDFQKVYFLILAVNPALQFPLLRQFHKSF